MTKSFHHSIVIVTVTVVAIDVTTAKCSAGQPEAWVLRKDHHVCSNAGKGLHILAQGLTRRDLPAMARNILSDAHAPHGGDFFMAAPNTPVHEPPFVPSPELLPEAERVLSRATLEGMGPMEDDLDDGGSDATSGVWATAVASSPGSSPSADLPGPREDEKEFGDLSNPDYYGTDDEAEVEEESLPAGGGQAFAPSAAHIPASSRDGPGEPPAFVERLGPLQPIIVRNPDSTWTRVAEEEWTSHVAVVLTAREKQVDKMWSHMCKLRKEPPGTPAPPGLVLEPSFVSQVCRELKEQYWPQILADHLERQPVSSQPEKYDSARRRGMFSTGLVLPHSTLNSLRVGAAYLQLLGFRKA